MSTAMTRSVSPSTCLESTGLDASRFTCCGDIASRRAEVGTGTQEILVTRIEARRILNRSMARTEVSTVGGRALRPPVSNAQ